jgi:hypothetical protein
LISTPCCRSSPSSTGPPTIEDRVAELLRMVPTALADVEQERAVRPLGQFGITVHAVGTGPEVH